MNTGGGIASVLCRPSIPTPSPKILEVTYYILNAHRANNEGAQPIRPRDRRALLQSLNLESEEKWVKPIADDPPLMPLQVTAHVIISTQNLWRSQIACALRKPNKRASLHKHSSSLPSNGCCFSRASALPPNLTSFVATKISGFLGFVSESSAFFKTSSRTFYSTGIILPRSVLLNVTMIYQTVGLSVQLAGSVTDSLTSYILHSQLTSTENFRIVKMSMLFSRVKR